MDTQDLTTTLVNERRTKRLKDCCSRLFLSFIYAMFQKVFYIQSDDFEGSFINYLITK